MNKFLFAVAALAILVLGIPPGGCSSARVAEPAAGAPVTVTPAPLSAWDELVKAAQREGRLSIYGTEMGPVVVALRDTFARKFDISVEAVSGRPPEVVAKITAERRAGIYNADVGHLGETTQIIDIKPLGITVPLSNQLILPEVTDPAKWVRNQVPFVDEEKHVLVFMAMATPGIMVNTDIVADGEIASFVDLVNPKWKGKIVLSDPRVSGPAPNQLANMIKIFGRERATELFKQLAAQQPMITRDQRQLVEWVARGRYPVGYGLSPTVYWEFKAAGAPVKALILKEPTYITGGPGNIAVFDRNPNPKVTQLYINWLLTREGSTIWSKATGWPSGRVDVTKEGFDPAFLPRGDESVPDLNTLDLRAEVRRIAAEIFK